jgi:hypothetical protein
VAEAVYLLCSVASAVCALALIRAYRRARLRLLFWSAFCFVALTLNSVTVFIDLVLVPSVDLRLVRGLFAIVGLGGLLFALIWDPRS